MNEANLSEQRSALHRAYRQDEESCIAERLRQVPAAAIHDAAECIAARLVQGARRQRPHGLDAFLQTYGLATEEGIALMCLAEALLRVPDPATADALIEDKLGSIDWAAHLGESASTFVNAATFSLMLTGRVLEQGRTTGERQSASLRSLVARLGEPVIRQATLQAMKILSGQFVFGPTIDEALKRAALERRRGFNHSFDMLGEAAMTFADAERYCQSYSRALDRIAAATPRGIVRSPGLSVKLSALDPQYGFRHAEAAKARIVPRLKDLAARARDADIHFTIDAEEAERLELSLDIVEALVRDDDLFTGGWRGFGLAIQAYQKRAVPIVDWVTALARRYNRRLMVRLVKGAYWDTEIKASQVGGYEDYPVFTRKQATDVSYLACAARLLAAPDAIYPAFATHNAYTIGAVKALAGAAEFEFQRLHGMGEDVYAELAKIEDETEGRRTPVRIYAPVGGPKDLLAYLVRRLLENGANTSFVHRMANADVPVAHLVRDPVAELKAIAPRRNPRILLPRDLFAPDRQNSHGVDLADPRVAGRLKRNLDTLAPREWTSKASIEATGSAEDMEPRAIRSPHDHRRIVGFCYDATEADARRSVDRALSAQPDWDGRGGDRRAQLLDACADAFEANREPLLSLCQREAGKTIVDAVLEVREAVDFLRFYAAEARRLFSRDNTLPGPTGESNRLRLCGRGVFVTISPWNFPLAIFIGPAAAALAAGNTVVAKPAEQTPLIAALAVRLCHEAGVPADVLQLLPGDGELGAALVADPRIAGVAFTGSVETARRINRSLAAREGAIATLIAETGGQNVMIVDSSALPEQVCRDVISSAFQSTGQRCSSLRLLYVQEDVADVMLAMIRGAFEALVIGDPEDWRTDVGPVIDIEAREALKHHIAQMRAAGRSLWERELLERTRNGTFVAPTIIEVANIGELQRENFGPVLHVARFRADELDTVVDAVNSAGYGLTLGLHSRLAATWRRVEGRAKVGNLYINRNQIGAVVGSQPFGGEGLSGTGPKAGGSFYVQRFATERVTSMDTTAAGGNASLLASGEP